MNDTDDLIRWFWSECSQPFNGFKGAGLCQCQTENFIKKTTNPNLMRAFLMFSIFIDQHMFTHVPSFYGAFRNRFKLPKLYFCPGGGTSMASPNWLIYSLYGYDKKSDWTLCQEVGKSVFNTVKTWLHTHKTDKKLCDDFDSSLKKEILTKFEKNYVEKIHEITRPENYYAER